MAATDGSEWLMSLISESILSSAVGTEAAWIVSNRFAHTARPDQPQKLKSYWFLILLGSPPDCSRIAPGLLPGQPRHTQKHENMKIMKIGVLRASPGLLPDCSRIGPGPQKSKNHWFFDFWGPPPDCSRIAPGLAPPPTSPRNSPNMKFGPGPGQTNPDT